MKKLAVLILLLLVVGLVGCDHASKRIAQQELRGQPPVELVSGVLDLSYAENRGVGFNFLRWLPEEVRRPLILTVRPIALLLFGFLWFRSRKRPWPEQVGFAFILAGAIGNIVDTFARGYVIDFIHLHYWPIFNAADAYLVIGVGLFFLVTLLRRKDGPAEPTPSESPS